MKTFAGLFTISFLFLSCSNPAQSCSEYRPVCGKVNVQCIKAPCDPALQTFTNECEAKQAKAFDIVDGACPFTGDL